MERIVHTNPFTGREFTSKERDYCRTHDTETEVVHTDGKFQFNIHGVCVNPEEAVRIEDYLYRVVVVVAQSNGMWNYGLRYNLPPCYSGSCSAMYARHKENGYAERDAAVIAGLDEMEEKISSFLKERSTLREEDDEEEIKSACYAFVKLKTYLEYVQLTKRKIQTEPQLL